MKQGCLKLGLAGVSAFACLWVCAQSSYVVTNQNTQAIHVFTNNLGTADVVDSMVVFEGQLEAEIVADKAYHAPSDSYLASLQLLAQVKLFDELPATNEVGEVQGAIAALRDEPEGAAGKYYAWGISNAVPNWVPLIYTNGQHAAVNDGATNFITFVFNYPVGGGNPTYVVYLGEPVAPLSLTVAPLAEAPEKPAQRSFLAMEPSSSITSPSLEETGISGVSLLGIGGLGLDDVASASGVPGPLSASINFSVYETANGVFVFLDTANEAGSGTIYVKAWINGEWVIVGQAQANGSNHYEILMSSLIVVGQSYLFKVIDELGNEHLLGQPVAVKSIKMDSVTMVANVMYVTFNTEAGRLYQVLLATSPVATEWTPAVVYYPVDTSVDPSGWGYGSAPFTAAGASTTVKIPRGEAGNPANRAFFKIMKVGAP